MSYFEAFSNCYDNNHESDDSSTVFDADTVVPDNVPSLPTATATATATTDYLYNNNATMISSSPHSSQKESPQSFTSEFLRRFNSTRHHPTVPSTTTTVTATPIVYDANTVMLDQEESPATATRTEEIEISTNQSSSSSSKKRPVVTNSSSSHHSSRKKTRRSSRLKSDSEVEDENGLDDDEPDEAVINQSSSSQISTTKLTKHELKWKSKFEELRAYRRSNEHANVPQSNKQLGVWVRTQRAQYKKLKANEKSSMTPERIEKLESIGFEWVVPNKGGPKNESAWDKRFNELKAYKELHGHTNVPKRWKENKELGKWVGRQRDYYKIYKKNGKSSITSERIELLESIGFEWVCQNKGGPRNESAWNERFNELKEYKELHGHTNVLQRWKENKELGKWVNKQRYHYKTFQAKKKSQITPERIDMLESIGFEWVAQNDESAWNKRFTELKAYKELHGHTNVSQHFKDNKQLGTWVHTQRTEYKKFQANKKSSMTDERIQTLESIGFQWSCRPDSAL